MAEIEEIQLGIYRFVVQGGKFFEAPKSDAYGHRRFIGNSITLQSSYGSSQYIYGVWQGDLHSCVVDQAVDSNITRTVRLGFHATSRAAIADTDDMKSLSCHLHMRTRNLFA